MKKLPLWGKLLIAVVIAGGAAGIHGVTSLIVFSMDVAKKAERPEYIASVLSSICKINLPPDFAPQIAVGVMPLQMVTLVHKPDNSTFMLGSMPPSQKTSSDSRSLTNDLADHGNPYLFQSFTVDKNGSEIVAGQKFEYVTGNAVNMDGEAVSGFIGCTVLKDKKKVVVLYGISPTKNFNMEAAQKLLSSIESF